MIGSYCWVLVGSEGVLRQGESLNCRCCKHLHGSWWALACPGKCPGKPDFLAMLMEEGVCWKHTWANSPTC